MFIVAIKSGTSGHYDCDNCDMILSKIPSDNIPNVGDVIEFGDEDNRDLKKHLVREVKRTYHHRTKTMQFGEWIYVYVIKI